MIKHAAKYFSGQFLARGTVYLYSLLLAKILSKTGFVDFTLFLISANIYSRIANYSLNMLIVKMRYTGEPGAADAQESLYRFAGTFGLILTAFLSLLTWLTPLPLLFGASRPVFQAILVGGYLSSIENNAIEMYQSQFKSDRYMAYMFSFTLILGLLSGAALKAIAPTTALPAILAYVCSQFIVTVVFKNLRLGTLPDRSTFRRYIILGTPVFLYAVTTYVGRYLEVFMVKSMSTANSAANFAYIFRVTEALGLVSIAASAVTGPTLFKMLSRQKAEDFEKLTIQRIIGGQILVFLVYFFAIKPVTARFFPGFQDSLVILGPLVFLNFLQLAMGLLQVYLLHYNLTIYMLWVNVVFLALAVGLNYLAIPRWGMMGSAVVKNIVAAGILACYAWRIRKSSFPISKTGIVGLLAASGGLVAIVVTIF